MPPSDPAALAALVTTWRALASTYSSSDYKRTDYAEAAIVRAEAYTECADQLAQALARPVGPEQEAVMTNTPPVNAAKGNYLVGVAATGIPTSNAADVQGEGAPVAPRADAEAVRLAALLDATVFALNGEAVSEFEASFGPVALALQIREQLDALQADRSRLRQEVDQLQRSTWHITIDHRVDVREYVQLADVRALLADRIDPAPEPR